MNNQELTQEQIDAEVIAEAYKLLGNWSAVSEKLGKMIRSGSLYNVQASALLNMERQPSAELVSLAKLTHEIAAIRTMLQPKIYMTAGEFAKQYQNDVLHVPRSTSSKPLSETDLDTQSVRVKPEYRGLFSILVEALDQAQNGKGAERHNIGGNVPFEQQRMQQISDLIESVDGMTYQACKKITEGVNLPTLDRQERELLGAINYIAGMIIWLRKQPPTEDKVVVNVEAPACDTRKPFIPQPKGFNPGGPKL